MLQQTRVEAVIPYYRVFLERFPTIEALAAAPEHEVLAAWSGLGYYSRARNLHRAAKQIAAAGVPAARVPAAYDEVLALPGAGPYTAAAIASIALDLPHAAVDGNAVRVISRLTNDASEIMAPAARRRFAAEAARLLDSRRPGDFNQAMMDLGATVCLPRVPRCGSCPVGKFCAARAAGTERELPVRLKKVKARDVPLDLAILERDACVFLMKRASTERRLAGFWELPGKQLFPRFKAAKLAEFRHQIVNDRFHVTVWHIAARKTQPPNLPAGAWVKIAELGSIPLTTVAKKALACTATSRDIFGRIPRSPNDTFR
jgi:A/G-specific adenine glycosylase